MATRTNQNYSITFSRALSMYERSITQAMREIKHLLLHRQKEVQEGATKRNTSGGAHKRPRKALSSNSKGKTASRRKVGVKGRRNAHLARHVVNSPQAVSATK